MKKKICKLKLTATDRNNVLGVKVRTSFNGDRLDMAVCLAAIFEAWEQNPDEARRIAKQAVELIGKEAEA